LNKKVAGLIHLLRYKEYFFFVIVTTLLGATASYGFFGWKLVGVLVANWLAVGFSFMVNDVEDASDDALNPAKVNRNPVSAGRLSPKTAWIASWVVGVISAVIYFLLGWLPFIPGMICLMLGLLYSWRKVRFKNLAFIDMISHCMMLAGLQFLAGFFAFDWAHTAFARWFFPFLFVVCISLYGELFNEIRDLKGDLEAGLRHTAAVLGAKPTYWIMLSVIVIGVASAAVMVFVVRLIASRVLWVCVGFAVLFLIFPLIKAWKHKDYVRLQESLQKPLEIAAAFALLVQFIVPWVIQMMKI
jgi:4-hydroxybenzoate polyprenyltransferase